MESECVLLRPEYVDLLDGDHLAALMLGQIVYWYSPTDKNTRKLQAKLRGRPCLAKNSADWWDELRLTKKQAHRCLEVLRARGFIKSEVHLFAGKTAVFLQLIAHEKLLPALPEVLTGTPWKCLLELPVVPVGTPITESTTETTTESTYALASLAPENQEKVLEKFQGEEHLFNADDVNKNSISKLTLVPKNLQDITTAWKIEVGILSKGSFIKNLTNKEKGQLKIVYKQVPDKAVELVKYAIRNWYKFVAEVQAQKGVQGGLSPTTGFFCKHFEIAMQLIALPATEKVVSEPKAVAYVTKPVEITDLASYEDVQETLAALAAMDKKGIM